MGGYGRARAWWSPPGWGSGRAGQTFINFDCRHHRNAVGRVKAFIAGRTVAVNGHTFFVVLADLGRGVNLVPVAVDCGGPLDGHRIYKTRFIRHRKRIEQQDAGANDLVNRIV